MGIVLEMRIFKYRTFEKWAKKQGLTDEDLKKAVLEIENELEGFKIMAEAFLNLTNEQINTLINNLNLVELDHE